MGLLSVPVSAPINWNITVMTAIGQEHRAKGRELCKTLRQLLLKPCCRRGTADSCASCISDNKSCLVSHEEAKIWKVHIFLMSNGVRRFHLCSLVNCHVTGRVKPLGFVENIV